MTTILENVFLCLLCTVHVLAVIFSINPNRVCGGGPSTPPPPRNLCGPVKGPRTTSLTIKEVD